MLHQHRPLYCNGYLYLHFLHGYPEKNLLLVQYMKRYPLQLFDRFLEIKEEDLKQMSLKELKEIRPELYETDYDF